ncbi:MAG: O-methyltransferase [Clostridia bacterium]|nr:O-methyltransferase [Clostridia bacterium]
MEYLDKLKQISNENHIPIIKSDGLDFLVDFIQKQNPKNILEIGTAVGYSGSYMLLNTTDSKLTTIELNPTSYQTATKTFKQMELSDRVTQILGDAKEVIKTLNQEYDFIFLDGPKGQYLAYMEDLIRLTKVGGYILADNVYFHGLVNGQEFVKHKLRSMVVNLRKFLKFIQEDERLNSKVYDIGDGISLIQVIKK